MGRTGTGERARELTGSTSSAAKVLGLLTALLRQGNGAVSLTDVAISAGLPKSTTHRLLRVLSDHGYVERDGSRYRLTRSLLDMGGAADSSQFADLRAAAYPQLAEIFDHSTAIAVQLGVLQGRSIRFLDKLMRPEGVRLLSQLGDRFPATCTALGKAVLAFGPAERVGSLLREPLPRATARSVTGPGQLLAQLRQTRRDRYAVELEEARPGVFCVAAPVLTSGAPVAAVSLAMPSVTLARSGSGRVVELGRLVTTSARVIGEALESRNHDRARTTTSTAV